MSAARRVCFAAAVLLQTACLASTGTSPDSGAPGDAGSVYDADTACESDEELCARLGATCGPLEAVDDCGLHRLVECTGCCPETDKDFCEWHDVECGPLTGHDFCDSERTVESCGTCGEGQLCAEGKCACAPETNAELCAAAGLRCGALNALDRCGAVREIPSCGTCPVIECQEQADLDTIRAIRATLPTISVRSKQKLTLTTTFPSASDSQTFCRVDLEFKDSNGNGQLDPYEDWRLEPQDRATDLLARMSVDTRLALMAHASLDDVPTATSAAPSAATEAVIAANIRFGRTAANSATPTARATWANSLQERCEASALGIPFVLSTEPAHSNGNGRTHAKGFFLWPSELGLAATDDLGIIEQYGKWAAQDYRAIGVRMALSPSANLFTEPRWFEGQFTFGEDSARVGAMVQAYIKGFQGAAVGRDSVACVVKSFPGAGPAKGGFDARLEKGKYVTYPGNNLDAHLAPFQKAFEAGVAGVMPGYAIMESGSWSGLGGLIDGATIEQVGASFNAKLLTDVLRTHYQFDGLVLAPWGVLEDKGVSPFGAPWGMENRTRAERAAKAVGAGVDQFGGLNDVAPLAAARSAGTIAVAQVNASARRALVLMFQLGLFENPYVDAAQAAQRCSTDAAYLASLKALDASLVLLHNAPKPAGWLNGNGDGTQTGDLGNAGNGSGKVLPAPPGTPYLLPGTNYFVSGSNWNLDYIQSVSSGYGTLTNDAISIWWRSSGQFVPLPTDADRIAYSDYVLVRVSAPYVKDPDSGSLDLPLPSLEYAGSGVASWLDDLSAARAAISANAASKAQIVVFVDSGRPTVLSEIMAYNPSAVYLTWTGFDRVTTDDKVLFDIAFGIYGGTGKLPVGLPASDAAVQASTQKSDVAGDGQHATFVKGFGLTTRAF